MKTLKDQKIKVENVKDNLYLSSLHSVFCKLNIVKLYKWIRIYEKEFK